MQISVEMTSLIRGVFPAVEAEPILIALASLDEDDSREPKERTAFTCDCLTALRIRARCSMTRTCSRTPAWPADGPRRARGAPGAAGGHAPRRRMRSRRRHAAGR